MARAAQDVTDAELAILQALWERGPATIRQLAQVVYGDASASSYATVQKLLERLEAKDCVQRDRSSSVHAFRASVDREELIGRRLRAVADSLCGGSIAPLLTHLVERESLTEKERKELRDLIAKLDRPR